MIRRSPTGPPPRRPLWPWLLSAAAHGAAFLVWQGARDATRQPPPVDLRLDIASLASEARAAEESVEVEAPDVEPVAAESIASQDPVVDPPPPEDRFEPDLALEPPESASIYVPTLGPQGARLSSRFERTSVPRPESPSVARRSTTQASASTPYVEGATSEATNRPPPYPPESRARREQGVVVLLLEIDDQGHVARVEVLASSGFLLLDASARNAALEWRYRPARIDGRAIAASLRQRVRFTLAPMSLGAQ